MERWENMVHIYIVMSMFLLVFGVCMAEDDMHVDGYFRWTHEDIATTDLLCPECCQEDFEPNCLPKIFFLVTDKKTTCCVYYAKPYWNLPKYSKIRSYTDLQVRYEKSHGKALVYYASSHSVQQPYNSTFYDLDHRYSRLSSFPENLCQFPRIVCLSVPNNIIENITDLGCLKILDTLDVSYNRLKAIKSLTFANLPYLRNLNLSNNLITTLEPGTFKYHPRSFRYVNFSYNQLLTIDITNIILGYFFREVDYSHNFIANLTNLSKWKGFQENDKIGGGWFNVQYNNFSRLFNLITLKECGFDSLRSVLRTVFNYHGLLMGNPWICDCFAYTLLYVTVQAQLHFDSVGGIICSNPTFLRGYSLKDFRKNKQLFHKLTCNVTLRQKCPPKCICYEQPSRNRVVVNCSLSRRRTMPKIVPDLDNLDIDLSKNKIEVFQNLDYLKRTIRIDLSDNKIKTVDPMIFTIQKLDVIYLYNNSITSLDRSVQLKNPCKLRLGHVHLGECTCHMHWMTIWLDKQSVMKCITNLNIITCIDRITQVNISDMSENELCPPATRENASYIWFVVTTFCILALLLLYSYFRYEIFLILRHYNFNLLRHNFAREIIHDIYLSFNVENDDVRQWTIRTLVSHLEIHGYKVCLPPRDFKIGETHSEQIRQTITRTQSFLIVLSENYFNSQFQAIEWIHIWDAFKMDINSQLIIINHDMLTNKDLHDRKLKAFLRMGYSLDFSDFKNTLLMEIEKRLKVKTLANRYEGKTTCLRQKLFC